MMTREMPVANGGTQPILRRRSVLIRIFAQDVIEALPIHAYGRSAQEIKDKLHDYHKVFLEDFQGTSGRTKKTLWLTEVTMGTNEAEDLVTFVDDLMNPTTGLQNRQLFGFVERISWFSEWSMGAFTLGSYKPHAYEDLDDTTPQLLTYVLDPSPIVPTEVGDSSPTAASGAEDESQDCLALWYRLFLRFKGEGGKSCPLISFGQGRATCAHINVRSLAIMEAPLGRAMETYIGKIADKIRDPAWESQGSTASEVSAAQAAAEVPIPSPGRFDWSDAYDEQLQEDVFLGKLEIKNTFYNIPVASSMTEIHVTPDTNWKSAPAALVQKNWRTKFPEMEAAHNRGECKPCAYFLYKTDGCRNSENCPYCHLCRKGAPWSQIKAQ
ncbi:SLC8A1 [Symbiodinium microadriaticum]|nr:SLC8A1 [Symbiodinium microadriaticum]